MKKNTFYTLILTFLTFGVLHVDAQTKTLRVDSFDKIILSPYISATLVEGDKESVYFEYANVSEDEINVEVEGKTLRIYLDGAKTLDRNEKVRGNGYNMSRAYYEGAEVKAIITYKSLRTLSVRGEEVIRCKSTLDQRDFTLRIYGESQVYLSEVNLDKLKVTIYGQSYFEVQKGTVGYQKFTAYGESKVNTLAIDNADTKILAYGESDFRVNVADRLKVTCYGETHVTYEGSPKIDRGFIIGEATIRKIG